MRHLTLLSTLSIAALAGCASTPEDTPRVTDGGMVLPSTRVVGVKSELDLRTNPTISRHVTTVAGTPAAVWTLLVAAYDSIGIPVTTSVPPQGLIGNEGFKVRRKLKDAPLTRYLDCGNTQGGPSAETYEITLAVKTQLVPADGAVTATTMVNATGRPVALASNDIRCSSTGRLEARIAQLIGGVPPKN